MHTQRTCNKNSTIPYTPGAASQKHMHQLICCSVFFRNEVFRRDHRLRNILSAEQITANNPLRTQSTQTIDKFLRRNAYSLSPACGMPAACPSNRPKAQTTPMFLQCFYGALTSCTNIRIFSYMAAESVSFSTKIFKHSCRLDASDRPANQQLSPKYANQAPSFTSFSLRRSSDNPCTWMHQTAPPTSS